MPRKPRPLDRDGGVLRDADLLVVASEDKYAVEQYFARFKTRRVKILVAPTEDCRSSPQDVLDRLDAFLKEYVTEENDTFWLCIDRDRWDESSLARVLRTCLTRGYNIAISCPCFELWILLHFENVAGEPRQTCEQIMDQLRIVLGGGYGKECCKRIVFTKESVESAMARARALDAGNEHTLIPTNNVSQVYKILDAVIAKDRIEFF